MACRTLVTGNGDLVTVRHCGLPDKAILFAFCDEVSASSFLCLTREEAIELAAALVLLAETSGNASESAA